MAVTDITASVILKFEAMTDDVLFVGQLKEESLEARETAEQLIAVPLVDH